MRDPKVETALADCRQRSVEGRAGSHGLDALRHVRVVVTADIHWVALRAVELAGDLCLLPRQQRGHRGEQRLQLSIGGLVGQCLRPVQRQVEVTAANVQFPHLARRRLVGVQELAVGRIQRVGERQCLVVSGLAREVLNGYLQGQELPE